MEYVYVGIVKSKKGSGEHSIIDASHSNVVFFVSCIIAVHLGSRGHS